MDTTTTSVRAHAARTSDEVTVVQRAHRRHEPDGLALAARLGDRRADLGLARDALDHGYALLAARLGAARLATGRCSLGQAAGSMRVHCASPGNVAGADVVGVLARRRRG